jgi:hypothetical protein
MEGYAKLATIMGAHPEVAVFKRFGTLNTQNILYLQAELTDLELRLKKYAKQDADSGHPGRILYSRDWQTLSESSDVPTNNNKQWNTILSIREKLKEFSKCKIL